jgi:hypothetical protein
MKYAVTAVSRGSLIAWHAYKIIFLVSRCRIISRLYRVMYFLFRQGLRVVTSLHNDFVLNWFPLRIVVVVQYTGGYRNNLPFRFFLLFSMTMEDKKKKKKIKKKK